MAPASLRTAGANCQAKDLSWASIGFRAQDFRVGGIEFQGFGFRVRCRALRLWGLDGASSSLHSSSRRRRRRGIH